MARTRMNRPELNLPRAGTLKAVYFAPNSKDAEKPDLQIHGVWEPNPDDAGFEGGEGSFYIGYHHTVQLTKTGLIAPNGTTRDGFPAFRVVHTGRMCLWIREQKAEGSSGRKRHVVVAVAVDREGEPLELEPQADPPDPPTGEPPKASAAPKASTGGAPRAPGAPGAAKAPAAASSAYAEQTPKSIEEKKREIVRAHRVLREEYLVALDSVAKSMMLVLGCEQRDLDQSALQAGAATLMIRGEQRGLQAYVGLHKHLLGSNGDGEKPQAGTSKAAGSASPAAAKAAAQPAVSAGVAAGEEEDDDLPF